MKRIVAYAAPVVALVAALTALLGPSRRPDGVGVTALTPFGWAAAGFALIAFGVALYNVGVQQTALRRAQEELGAMRRTARGEFDDGVALVVDVLTFAALMPFATSTDGGPARKLPSERASDLDLRAASVLEELKKLRMDPGARLNAPYIPSAVPFSPTTRTAMTILVEESGRAIATLQSALQTYSARAVNAAVMDAASELTRDPFLLRLTRMKEKYAARSQIEDSNLPGVVNLYFLNDTSSPSERGYLALLDKVDRLRAASDQLVAGG